MFLGGRASGIAASGKEMDNNKMGRRKMKVLGINEAYALGKKGTTFT